MQNSSAFQFLALDTIHESAANPRRTFEESKLHELAESSGSTASSSPSPSARTRKALRLWPERDASAPRNWQSFSPYPPASSRSTTHRRWSGR